MIIATIVISLASIALSLWTLRSQRRIARNLRRIAELDEQTRIANGDEPPALEAS